MSNLVSPFNTFNQLNRELNRIFDARPLTHQVSQRVVEGSGWTPRVDIAETTDAFCVKADIPGVNPEDIEISLHKGVLTVRGERKTDDEVNEGNFTRRERYRGTFSRQFNLPETADEETVSARSANGVLEITIPKVKKTEPINIVVESE